MENQHESKDQQNKLEPVLNLSYSNRHQLITSLSELTAILQCNTAIPDDAKQRTCQKIDQSMRLLVELSPFQSTASTVDSAVLFEEKIFGQLTGLTELTEQAIQSGAI